MSFFTNATLLQNDSIALSLQLHSMLHFKLYKQIRLQKFTAFAMLAIMSFVIGVKVFHQHPEERIPTGIIEMQKEFSSKHTVHHIYQQCHICDFDFLKNTDASVSVPQISTLNFTTDFTVKIPDFPTAGIIIVSLLRGPPSLV